MYWFLIPLLLGFAFNWASVFTTVYSARWGARRGQWISAVLRDLLGIPLWAGGLILAFRAPAPPLFAVGTIAVFVGWLLIVAGSLLIAWALVTLGRRAAAPTVQDTLMQREPYAHLRHPIYAGVLGQFAGLCCCNRPGRSC